MKRKLIALFAMTAFVTTAAFADWTLDTVHEDSLAYNYPGSDKALIMHGTSRDVGGPDETMSMNDDADKTEAVFWPKVRVHEDSLAYNYPGSNNELVSHAGAADVGDADNPMMNDDTMEDKTQNIIDTIGSDNDFDNYR